MNKIFATMLNAFATILGANTLLSWTNWKKAKNLVYGLKNWSEEMDEDHCREKMAYAEAVAASIARADHILKWDNVRGNPDVDTILKAINVRFNMNYGWPLDAHERLVNFAPLLAYMDKDLSASWEGVGSIQCRNVVENIWSTLNHRGKPEKDKDGNVLYFYSPLSAMNYLVGKRKSLPSI